MGDTVGPTRAGSKWEKLPSKQTSLENLLPALRGQPCSTLLQKHPCDLWVHDLPALCYLNSPWLLLWALVPVPRRQLVIPLFYRPVSRAQPSTWLGPVKPRPGSKGQSQQAWATSFSGVMAFLGPAGSHLLCQQHRTEPSSSTVH